MSTTIDIGTAVVVRGVDDSMPAAAGVFLGLDAAGNGIIENTHRVTTVTRKGREVSIRKYTTRHSLASIEVAA